MAEKIFSFVISACVTQTGKAFRILEAEAKGSCALLLIEKADSLETNFDLMTRSAFYSRASELGEYVWGKDDEDVMEWRKIALDLERDYIASNGQERSAFFDQTELTLEPDYYPAAPGSRSYSRRSSKAASKVGTPRRATDFKVAAEADDQDNKRAFFAEFEDAQSEQGKDGSDEVRPLGSEGALIGEEALVKREERASKERVQQVTRKPTHRDGVSREEATASRTAHPRVPSKEEGGQRTTKKPSQGQGIDYNHEVVVRKSERAALGEEAAVQQKVMVPSEQVQPGKKKLSKREGASRGEAAAPRKTRISSKEEGGQQTTAGPSQGRLRPKGDRNPSNTYGEKATKVKVRRKPTDAGTSLEERAQRRSQR
eukprot:CAMPEP_0172640322 /NCGR_PEP_ID=MMETSP1068-20121228/222596_1 /TAXON_ID=35684 /ORGANISM="Pseudopedinella elastica, Strain CCMP716" /LENGTH=370 /DNA_ID=CAMNT_0013453677 /DNA_START=142 /DNA_END=1250 /DNA_ORIENTATION=-